jgi:hypothetical protein
MNSGRNLQRMADVEPIFWYQVHISRVPVTSICLYHSRRACRLQYFSNIKNDERLADLVRRLCGLSGQNLCTLVSFSHHIPQALKLASVHFTLEVSRLYLGSVMLIDYSVPEIKAVSNFFCVEERRKLSILDSWRLCL